MKRFIFCCSVVMCLFILFPCAIKAEKSLTFANLNGVFIDDITMIDIIKGSNGKITKIQDRDDIENIYKHLQNGTLVEYKKEKNTGGWLYSLNIYTNKDTSPVEYTLYYGCIKDEKNYKLENDDKLKNAIEIIVEAANAQKIIQVQQIEGVLEIKIDDKIVEFTDKPFIDEFGRTQVPVRELCELLDRVVYWFEDPQRVAISSVPASTANEFGGAGGPSIEFIIGESYYTKNGKSYQMDTVSKIINNKTYVPLRTAGEFLNYKVVWVEQ